MKKGQAGWVEDGVLEVGRGEYGDSFVRVIDESGIVSWLHQRNTLIRFCLTQYPVLL